IKKSTLRKIEIGDKVDVDVGSDVNVSGRVRYVGNVHFASGCCLPCVMRLDDPKSLHDGRLWHSVTSLCQINHGVNGYFMKLRSTYISSRERQEELERRKEEIGKEPQWIEPPLLLDYKEELKNKENPYWLKVDTFETVGRRDMGQLEGEIFRHFSERAIGIMCIFFAFWRKDLAMQPSFVKEDISQFTELSYLLVALYFEEIFEKIKSQHPVVVFTDIEPFKMELLLNFMYQGEAEVEQENFLSFMKTGEALKIKGISVNDVYTYKNSVFNKKRKRSSSENVRSKRRLKDISETSSLENDVIKEEPYFDGDKELLKESFAKSSLSSKEMFDSLGNPRESTIHDEPKVSENFYHVDGVSVEMGNVDAEAHPSISSEYCTVNNAQEAFLVKKKRVSVQRGKNSSKVSSKNALEVIENMGNEHHNHVPIEGKARRRCSSCARLGREKRTKLFCTDCHLPFCKECFTPWHLQLQIDQTL
ncbi:Sex determination protein fruitless, partial [Armadillidium vulgare]